MGRHSRRQDQFSHRAAAFPGSLQGDSSDLTREKILDAALALFIAFGLRRNTMDDVAREAGVGRATVYRRFGDKDSLVQAVILRECFRSLMVIEERTCHIENPLEGLLDAFVMASHLAHGHPLLETLFGSEAEHILPFLTLRMGPLMQLSRTYLAQRIREAQQKGAIKSADPEVLAELLLRLIQSLVLCPDGAINPADESSLRRFCDTTLRPLISP